MVAAVAVAVAATSPSGDTSSNDINPSNDMNNSTGRTTSATTTNTRTIDLLTLLHQYQSLHAAANDNLKSCLWNITKARRGRAYQTIASGGGKLEYTPEDVREELRAQALLEWRGEAETTKEEDDDNNSNDDDDTTTTNDNDHDNDHDGKFVLHYLDAGMNATMNQQQQQQ